MGRLMTVLQSSTSTEPILDDSLESITYPIVHGQKKVADDCLKSTPYQSSTPPYIDPPCVDNWGLSPHIQGEWGRDG